MKQLIIGMIIAFASVTAFATTETATATSSSSDAASQSAATAQGGNVIIEAVKLPTETKQNVEYSGSQTIHNVPSVNGPSLTTSNDTCMGSTSGSVNIAGIGIGGGSTWTDNNCKRLKNARELWNMGMKAASLAILCKDDENKEALEVTGYKCPAKKAEVSHAPDAVNY